MTPEGLVALENATGLRGNSFLSQKMYCLALKRVKKPIIVNILEKNDILGMHR